MGHPHEAVYLAVIDTILEATHEGRLSSAGEIGSKIVELIKAKFPDAPEQEISQHQMLIMRYLQAFLQVMGGMGSMPGTRMSMGIGPDGRMWPVLVATGAIATVVHFRQRDDLAAFLAWVMPPEQQSALGTLLKDRFGISSDFVQANQFTFLPEDWNRLKVADILNDAMVRALTGNGMGELEQDFRQAVLRRGSPSHMWQMPDGMYVLPICVPVTIASSVAPFYWEHGRDDELEMAGALGSQIAEALTAREFMGFQAEVYCGHLHMGAVEAVMRNVVADLESRGAVQVKVPALRQMVRLGRNMPCPCGSGKKYKKCCGE